MFKRGPQRRKSKKGNITQTTIQKHFPEIKNTWIYILKEYRVPVNTKPEKPKLRHLLLKVLYLIKKKKIHWTSRQRGHLTY